MQDPAILFCDVFSQDLLPVQKCVEADTARCRFRIPAALQKRPDSLKDHYLAVMIAVILQHGFGYVKG